MNDVNIEEMFATLDGALSEISSNRRTHVVLQTYLQRIKEALATAQARIVELEALTQVGKD